jgi:cobyrinic acid a,c-diamide synthase
MKSGAGTVRIGVIRDSSFGFHYADDLEGLQRAGAELVFIDSINDRRLPQLDGLFIAGGFPETHMDLLQKNVGLRQAIRAFVADNKPVYAECGGLMYLCRSIEWRGRKAEMVGAISADCVMQETPVGKGYMRLRETRHALWGGQSHCPSSGVLRAHEFHYSRLVNLDPSTRFAYQVLRGTGVDGRHDGIIKHKLLASYAHLRDVSAHHWTQRFVDFVRADKLSRAGFQLPLQQTV